MHVNMLCSSHRDPLSIPLICRCFIYKFDSESFCTPLISLSHQEYRVQKSMTMHLIDISDGPQLEDILSHVFQQSLVDPNSAGVSNRSRPRKHPRYCAASGHLYALLLLRRCVLPDTVRYEYTCIIVLSNLKLLCSAAPPFRYASHKIRAFGSPY